MRAFSTFLPSAETLTASWRVRVSEAEERGVVMVVCGEGEGQKPARAFGTSRSTFGCITRLLKGVVREQHDHTRSGRARPAQVAVNLAKAEQTQPLSLGLREPASMCTNCISLSHVSTQSNKSFKALKEALGLEHEHNLVHRVEGGRLGKVDGEVGVGRVLVRVVCGGVEGREGQHFATQRRRAESDAPMPVKPEILPSLAFLYVPLLSVFSQCSRGVAT